MRGLLLKDCYIAKSNLIVLGISLIVIGFGLAFLMESSTILVLSPAVFTTAVFISITADYNSKWNKFAVTMPVSRQQIIAGKYYMFVILTAVGIIVGLIPCAILSFIKHDVTLQSILLLGLLGIEISFLSGSFSLPLAYTANPENSQVVFMLSFVVASGIVTGLIRILNIFFSVKENILNSFLIVLFISFILLITSYKIAVNAYSKKDIN